MNRRAAGRQRVRKDGGNGYRDLARFGFKCLVWGIFNGFQIHFGRWDGEGTKETSRSVLSRASVECVPPYPLCPYCSQAILHL